MATALGLWGTEAQQQTYLPAFTGDAVPAAALALAEPTVLFDALAPATTAERTAEGFTLNGVKSAVPPGPRPSSSSSAPSSTGRPRSSWSRSSTPGLEVVADPGAGRSSPGLTRLELRRAAPGRRGAGETDGTTYAECVRLSRLAWCALAVGTGQAVLDYVTPYVKERRRSANRSPTGSRWRSWSPTSRSSCRRCAC